MKILFLCTGNSCRSIMAEALLNNYGGGKFEAYSAGSKPKGEIHSVTLEILAERNIPTENFRSKSWDEFIDTEFDMVITVCNNARDEICPGFPGKAEKLHWDIEDPAGFKGTDSDVKEKFREVMGIIEENILQLVGVDNIRTE